MRVPTDDAVKREAVLVGVDLGSRVTVDVPVQFAVNVRTVAVGQAVVEAVSLRLRVSEGERGLRDPVAELVVVFDRVEDAECVVVGV